MASATSVAKFENNINTKLEEMMEEVMQASLTGAETKAAVETVSSRLVLSCLCFPTAMSGTDHNPCVSAREGCVGSTRPSRGARCCAGHDGARRNSAETRRNDHDTGRHSLQVCEEDG